MPRSTILEKRLLEPIQQQLVEVENQVTQVDEGKLNPGDNVSELINDAQYQTLDEVRTAIEAVIDNAPEALDTLKEIADVLAENDDALQGLVDRDTEILNTLSGIQSELEILNRDRKINVEALTGDKILTTDDFCYQKYTVDADRTITLPDPPDEHQKFAFINDETSTGNLIIGEAVLEPSPTNRHEVIWDGTQWIVL